MANMPQAHTPPAEADESPSLRSVAGKMAAMISQHLSGGDVAELRRLEPHNPAAPAFWKLRVSHLEPIMPKGGAALDEAEKRWAAWMAGAAILHGLHRPGEPLGGALAKAGFSELRLTRLLRAEGDGLLDDVRRVAHFLSSKAQAADWANTADLILSDGHEWGDKVRRDMARDYYRNLK